jgi:hypothetical protein
MGHTEIFDGAPASTGTQESSRTTEDQRRRAARLVEANAADPEELRLFLEMLGLIDEGGEWV